MTAEIPQAAAAAVPSRQVVQPPAEAEWLADPRGERERVGEPAPECAATDGAEGVRAVRGGQPAPRSRPAGIPARGHPDVVGAGHRRKDDAGRGPGGAGHLPQARTHLRGDPRVPQQGRRGARVGLP